VKKKIDGDSNHQNHFIADTNVHPQKSSVDLKFDDYNKQVRDGAYPLHIALTNGASADVIEILLKAVGGNKDVLTMKNKFGKIPMEVAQQLNYRGRVLLLLNPNR
jgi:ankyrin repeat protein